MSSLSVHDLDALWITIRLAGLSTLMLLLVTTPLAWWLARSRHPARVVIEALVSLPLVLPPTVLGFYLLVLLGRQGVVGELLAKLGAPELVFSFSGLVVASMIYSLPFVVQPLQAAFRGLEQRQLEVASTLGASPIDRFFSIIVPQCRHGFLAAAVLGFAHTIGEFGVVLMIGGNIPGKTQVLSIAIYDHVESLEYAQAHLLSAGLLVSSFVLLLIVYATNSRFGTGSGR